MLKSLKLINYKALEDFEIRKLGRLNLIVGKNNSGKSSVLEGLRILAAQGNPSLINEVIIEHDDQILVQENEFITSFEGLFTGRAFPPDGSPVYIGTINREEFIEIRKVFFEETTVEKPENNGKASVVRTRTTFSERPNNGNRELDQTIQITSHQHKENPIYIDDPDRQFKILRRSKIFFDSVKQTPLSFIPTQFITPDSLAELWDKTVLTSYHTNIKDFLRFVSPELEDVAFIKTNNGSSIFFRHELRKCERTGIVKLKNNPRPIPLNSMGDGMTRILQLALGIYPAAGGILLIDEFENGLHFSIQYSLWNAIFKLASELDIQVFATTHSWDCIEAFTNAANEHDDEAVLCKIGYGVGINKNKIISTVYEKDDLLNLTQADMELR
ncbi:MAG: AAA family ATPase [Myxococcales bacterium]|jgi:AAA15 family ATPase/GTPase|nr:AAA family ATPase [Myxococcales bacterium]